jgi:hypothetical protein
VTVGGAQAQAQASSPFSSTPPVVTPPSSSGTNTNTGGGATGGTFPNLGTPTPPAVVSPSGGSSAPSNSPLPTVLSAVPAAVEKGLAPGLVILGLLVALAGAFGLGKVPDDVLAEKVGETACRLENREGSNS